MCLFECVKSWLPPHATDESARERPSESATKGPCSITLSHVHTSSSAPGKTAVREVAAMLGEKTAHPPLPGRRLRKVANRPTAPRTERDPTGSCLERERTNMRKMKARPARAVYRFLCGKCTRSGLATHSGGKTTPFFVPNRATGR